MTNDLYYCPVCGGNLIGDGYTTPIHCENVDLPLDVEADSGPHYCEAESESDRS